MSYDPAAVEDHICADLDEPHPACQQYYCRLEREAAAASHGRHAEPAHHGPYPPEMVFVSTEIGTIYRVGGDRGAETLAMEFGGQWKPCA